MPQSRRSKTPSARPPFVSITERCGSLDLGFLARYRTEKIRTWLEAFDGVGVKTSAAVVNKGATAREAEARIMEMAPATWSPAVLDDHHSLIELHGQKWCTYANPHCSACPLRDICPVGLSSTGPA